MDVKHTKLNDWITNFATANIKTNTFFRLRAAGFSSCIYGIWWLRNKRVMAREQTTEATCIQNILTLLALKTVDTHELYTSNWRYTCDWYAIPLLE